MSNQLRRFNPKPIQKGYWEKLNVPPRGARLCKIISEGVEFSLFKKTLSVSGIQSKDLAAALDITPTTLLRREKTGRFSVDESDRLFCFLQLNKSAIDLFDGDLSSSSAFLLATNKGLGGRKPIDMIRTTAEHAAVLNFIHQIDFSVVV